MKKTRIKNNNGFILLIVVTAVVVISIVVLGILSRNYSRLLVLNNKVKSIQAELVARGAMWKAKETLASGGTLTNYSETIDSVTYTVTYTTGTVMFPNVTTIVIDVTYT